MFSPGSKGRLTDRDLDRFASQSLFDRVARAVCHAGCLPRKELYEAWELARRARRLCRGGRVVDLGGGHGLVAHLMLLLDDSSPHAVVVDRQLPSSSNGVNQALVDAWPRLARRVQFLEADIAAVDLTEGDMVASSHACGRLTDVVLDRAASARARVAVLPCCHDFDKCDPGTLAGWVDPALAIDIMRAVTMERRGYRVATQLIAAAVTPKNRLLIAVPG